MKMAHYPPVKPVACPVCGKHPKDVWDINPGGGFVKLRCKPWFRKAHLEIERGAANPDYAYWKAVKAWNEKVQEIKDGKATESAEEQPAVLEYVKSTLQGKVHEKVDEAFKED